MLKALVLGKKDSDNQLFQLILDEKIIAICYGKVTINKATNLKLTYKYILNATTRDGVTSFGYVDEVTEGRG